MIWNNFLYFCGILSRHFIFNWFVHVTLYDLKQYSKCQIWILLNPLSIFLPAFSLSLPHNPINQRYHYIFQISQSLSFSHVFLLYLSFSAVVCWRSVRFARIVWVLNKIIQFVVKDCLWCVICRVTVENTFILNSKLYFIYNCFTCFTKLKLYNVYHI